METRERIVVITGANSGIGKAAAARFAADGDHVVMACRDVARSEAARQQIMAASGSRSVELMRRDVSSFASVQEFSSEFRSRYGKLDVLIHNAGYFNHGVRTYQFSPDGVEVTFATNIFGPLLLSERLLEPEQMAATHHRVCTAEEFREVTGALVDSRCEVLPALESGRTLSPREVAREVGKTRHAPPYASGPAGAGTCNLSAPAPASPEDSRGHLRRTRHTLRASRA